MPNRQHPPGAAGEQSLAARYTQLQVRLQELEKINAALMDRVERDMDAQGNSFSMFQSAIALEGQVRERTATLQRTLQKLEQTNRELQASNEAAQAANRAKSAFLAAMSHELRTPMNGVIGMTEVLLSSPLQETQRSSLTVIKRSALSLLTILNDILDFSKIEAGQMQLEQTAFNLHEAAEEALALLRPQILAKGLRLEIDYTAALPGDVIGDPVRYAQIITNLAGNALKFTSQGHIRLSAEACGEPDGKTLYRFTVADTGVGISPEVIPRLFNAFTQADSSTTRQYGGTGLGLAIVRRLCLLMGGDCGVHSEVGRGSQFWFTLPLQRGPAALSPELSRRSTSVLPRRELRVLLVEDNAINRQVALAMLEVLECECETAANGQLAVARVGREPGFDVLLMDCQMPVMDGFEATRQIRSREAHSGRHTWIVALTANAMTGDREACLACGMDDFLSKPFQLHELAELLDKRRGVTAYRPLDQQASPQ